MKDKLKNITPPILWRLMQSLFMKETYHPTWVTLNYEPMVGVKIFFDGACNKWQSRMVDGTYDSHIFDHLKLIPLKDKVIYDIGAHVGFHSLYFARLVGNKGKVVSFEPNSENVLRFKKNLEANPDMCDIVSINETAVSDSDGTEKMMMNMAVESGRSMGNFLEGSDTFSARETFIGKGFKEVSVKTMTIDAYTKASGVKNFPDIIKIDVEGAEFKVLKGAKNTLISKKPVLFIEVHSMKSMFDVTEFLRSLGYDMEMLKKETTGACFIEAAHK